MKAKPQKDANHSGVSWLTAADIMQSEVISVRTSDTIAEVERTIADAEISGVPVLAADDRVVGVLSTSDLVTRYAGGEDPEGLGVTGVDDDGEEVSLEFRNSANELTAGDVMTPEVETITPQMPVREVARRMVDGKIHRLLVVEKNRLVGIVTTIDILRAVAD